MNPSKTIAIVAAAAGLLATPAFAGKTAKVATPAISCGGSTQASMTVTVCASTTAAAAGFSVQWMTQADYEANGGWFASDDPRLCKGSFSGNANLSRYNLAAGECVNVELGDFLFDNGASTNCAEALQCGTDYVIRSFAHAFGTYFRSDFTPNLSCSTLPCGHEGGCTLTQGYWRTHNGYSDQCAADPAGPLCVQWPVTSLTLGTISYTDAEIVSILHQPAQGNGLTALAHQLIAAKLNIASGADDSAVAGAIAAADALIGGLVVPPVGSGSLPPSATSALTSALDEYNNGRTGPGHCE